MTSSYSNKRSAWAYLCCVFERAVSVPSACLYSGWFLSADGLGSLLVSGGLVDEIRPAIVVSAVNRQRPLKFFVCGLGWGEKSVYS